MAVTNLIATGAGALWNQWTPTGSTYSTAGDVANKQTLTFQNPATYLDPSASITQVQLTVTWATAAALGSITIGGTWSLPVVSNVVTNTNPVAGAMTSTVIITPPPSIGSWSIANLAAMEIFLYEPVLSGATSALVSVVVGSGIYLTVTDTSVVPPGTESETILLIL